MNEDDRNIVSDLIMLNGKTPSGIAKEIGVHRSNVLRWLKGEKAIGEETERKILSMLGISGGTLFSDVVHRWTIKSGDLLPLARILNWAGGRPYAMTYLSPNARKFKNYIMDPSCRPLLIYSPSLFIRIVFLKMLPPHLPETQNQKEDSLLDQTGLAKWRDIHQECGYPFIRVDPYTYQRFLKKEEQDAYMDIEEFDLVWNSFEDSGTPAWGSLSTKGEGEETPRTWDELVKQAKSKGISLQEASEKLLGRGEE